MGNSRKRWITVDELPFSRRIAYELINAGVIVSVNVQKPGTARGKRLIDADSVDRWLLKLAAEQRQQKQAKAA